MKQRTNAFLVGYSSNRDVVYGKEVLSEIQTKSTYVELMTRRQAEKALEKLISIESKRIIFKIVPVKVVPGRRSK